MLTLASKSDIGIVYPVISCPQYNRLGWDVNPFFEILDIFLLTKYPDFERIYLILI